MSNKADISAMYVDLLDAIAGNDIERILTFFSPDARIEQPFALPAAVTVTGTDELRAHFTTFATFPITMTVRDVEVHPTTVPEIFVVEWVYDVTAQHSGAAISVRNIVVARIHDEHIVESRDFHNTAALVGLLS